MSTEGMCYLPASQWWNPFLRQAAGRNLGFRWDGRAKHHLLISHSLLEKLLLTMCQHLRYDLSLHLRKDAWYQVRREVRS